MARRKGRNKPLLINSSTIPASTWALSQGQGRVQTDGAAAVPLAALIARLHALEEPRALLEKVQTRAHGAPVLERGARSVQCQVISRWIAWLLWRQFFSCRVRSTSKEGNGFSLCPKSKRDSPLCPDPSAKFLSPPKVALLEHFTIISSVKPSDSQNPSGCIQGLT